MSSGEANICLSPYVDHSFEASIGNDDTHHSLITSAPGKVLISGGYLVLDQAHQGNVLALSARMKCHIATLSIMLSNVNTDIHLPVVFFSKQRLAKPAILLFERHTGNLFQDFDSNVFVTKSIQYALLVVFKLAPSEFITCPGIALNVIADEVFYTGEGKTGLGSSACLVSSVVSAILRYFNVFNGEGDVDFLEVAHNLAQFVHCAAQGKVGSGFDVSTAFFGSQNYRRFSVDTISKLLQEDQAGNVSADALIHCISRKWDTMVNEFKLPPLLDVVVADVRSGSETPSMVKKVLLWNAESSNAKLWNELGRNNVVLSSLFQTLTELHDISPKDYAKAIHACMNHDPADLIECEHPVMRIVGEIREHFKVIRSQLKTMGNQAGVEVEPDSQSQLLDACMSVPGVVCAGVPGAGGFDAIFVIIMNPPAVSEGDVSVLTRLEQMWQKQSFNVKALSVREDATGLILSSL